MVTPRKTRKSQVGKTKEVNLLVSKSRKVKINTQAKFKTLSSNSDKNVPETSESSVRRKQSKYRKVVDDDSEFVAIEPVHKGKRIRLTERQREKFVERNENALLFDEDFSHSSSVPLISRLPSEYLVDSQSQSNFESPKQAATNNSATDFCDFQIPQLPLKRSSDDCTEEMKENEKENNKDAEKTTLNDVNCASTSDCKITGKDAMQSNKKRGPKNLQNRHESDVWLEKSDSEEESLTVCVKKHRTKKAFSKGAAEVISDGSILSVQKQSPVNSEIEAKVDKPKVLMSEEVESSHSDVLVKFEECSRLCATNIEDDGDECVEGLQDKDTKKVKLCRSDSASSLPKKVSRKLEVKSKDIRSFLSPKSATSQKVSEVDNENSDLVSCEASVTENGSSESPKSLSRHGQQIKSSENDEHEGEKSVSPDSSANISALSAVKKACGRRKKIRNCCNTKSEVVEVEGCNEVMELTAAAREGQETDSIKRSAASGHCNNVAFVKNACIDDKITKVVVDAVDSGTMIIKEKGTSDIADTSTSLCMKKESDLKIFQESTRKTEEFKSKAENVEKCVASLVAVSNLSAVKADEKVIDDVKTPVKNVLDEDLSQSAEKRTSGILKKSPSALRTCSESSLRKRVHFDPYSNDSCNDGRGSRSGRHTVSSHIQRKRKPHHGALFHNPEDKRSSDPPVVPFNHLTPGEQTKGEPILAELIDMKDSLTPKMLTKLSPYGVQSLRLALKTRGIRTVGDLAKLTESEISSLPIRVPNVETVRDVLCEYAKITPAFLKKSSDKAFWKVSCGVSKEKELPVEDRNQDSLKSLDGDALYKMNSYKSGSEVDDLRRSQHDSEMNGTRNEVTVEVGEQNVLDSHKFATEGDKSASEKLIEVNNISSQRIVAKIKVNGEIEGKTDNCGCEFEEGTSRKNTCQNLVPEISNAVTVEDCVISKLASAACTVELHDNEPSMKAMKDDKARIERHELLLDPLLPEAMLEDLRHTCVVLKRHKQGASQTNAERAKARNTLCRFIQMCTEHLLDLQDIIST